MSFDVGYVAEFGGGVRINLVSDAHHVADEAAAYRECRRLLDARPDAHRVEAWTGATWRQRYVTRATRGVPMCETGADDCVRLCCCPAPRDDGGEA